LNSKPYSYVCLSFTGIFHWLLLFPLYVILVRPIFFPKLPFVRILESETSLDSKIRNASNTKGQHD